MSVRSVSNYIVFSFLFLVAAAVFIKPAVTSPLPSVPVEASTSPARVPLLVIDAGHGGEDGGAEVGGVLEKDCNLAVAMRIVDLCTLFGKDVLPTRTDDTMLYDRYGDLDDYTGHRKTFDLRNRLRLAEESDAALFVGIHMNKFPESKYRGLQVWYSPNSSRSKNAAEYIRSYSMTYLDPTNERETKAASKSIYILNRIKMPAVLVECGFLSNPDECALLVSDEYRSRLAAVIFSSAVEFAEKE